MRHLAFAACLTALGIADAAPKRLRHREVAHAKQELPPVDDVDDNDEEDTDDEVEVAAAEDVEDDIEMAPVKVTKRTKKKGLRNWHVAFGPNVWMASVDAKVAVGEKNVGAAIDFFDLQRHVKFGLPLILEARYKRFSVVGDVMYGVVALEGGNEVGPLMVTLDGKVSSLQFDGIGGYRVFGDDESKLTLEARAGIRYQRMAISGEVGISGNGFAPKAIVDSSADLLAGARVELRPHRRFSVVGSADQSLVGSSTSTWSVGADANLRLSSYVLLSAGYRTMTQQKDTLSTVMHGPKFAIQVLF